MEWNLRAIAVDLDSLLLSRLQVPNPSAGADRPTASLCSLLGSLLAPLVGGSSAEMFGVRRYPVTRSPCPHWPIYLVLLLLLAIRSVPLAAESAQVARIGEVWVQSEGAIAQYHNALVDGLRDLGYVEGKNLVLLTRYANGDESRAAAPNPRVAYAQGRCTLCQPSSNRSSSAGYVYYTNRVCHDE